MHHAARLGASRHGIFYFRWPIPARMHPEGRRSDVKVSTGTRCPRTARKLSWHLLHAGQELMASASLSGMRYEEIRALVQAHFQTLLAEFKESVAEKGPRSESELQSLRNTCELAADDPADWAALTPGGSDALIRQACERWGVPEPRTEQARALLVDELRKGVQTYAAAAIDYNATFSSYDLGCAQPRCPEGIASLPAGAPKAHALPVTVDPNGFPGDRGAPPKPSQSDSFEAVASEYLAEIRQTAGLAPKTLSDKEDALALLREVTAGKPIAELTKEDAREVRSVLLRLPKNRRRNPKTANLKLRDALEVPGVETIASRTMNGYIGNLSTFFGWAVDQGYAERNVFDGMRVQTRKAAKNNRAAFTTEQAEVIVSRLTTHLFPVRVKDTHKWVTLIGAYTGMRLNEIAQLCVADVKCEDEIRYFNVTADSDPALSGEVARGVRKRLKNQASERKVPVSDRLIELGFLEFLQSRSGPSVRLFPDLSYCPMNGYGRNAGRWFKQEYLPKLGIESPALVFHSLRHTVVTELGRQGVEPALISALVGHAHAGITMGVYFKGHTLVQLKSAIDKLPY